MCTRFQAQFAHYIVCTRCQSQCAQCSICRLGARYTVYVVEWVQGARQGVYSIVCYDGVTGSTWVLLGYYRDVMVVFIVVLQG